MDDRAGRGGLRLAILSLLAIFALAVVAPRWQTASAQTPEAGKSDTPPPEVKKEKNIIVHIFTSAGYFLPVLVLVSIALVTLIVLLAMDLRMASSIPPQFVDEFTETVNKRRFKDAFERAKAEPSFLGRVLTAGMARLQYGLDDAREAALNAVESVRASKENLLTYVATIGTLGPMIGLVGTVFGMIRTFMVLGQGGQPRPSDLAEGISEALVITLLGIGLAVPAIFCHAFFRNRLIRISIDAANLADDLLTQLYHFSRKPAPADTRPATPPSGVAVEPRTPQPAAKTA